VHPSLYIARERMNLRPTTCHSSDTQVKIISGVPSASITVPSSTQSSERSWTASPNSKEQLWNPASHPVRLDIAPSKTWSISATGVPTEIWPTSPPTEQAQPVQAPLPPRTWSISPTSQQQQPVSAWESPSSNQAVQTWTSPSEVQPMNAWSSPPSQPTQNWSPSPDAQQVNTWSSPPNQASTWSASPISTSQDQTSWSSDQVWSTSPEDSAPNWIPRIFMEVGFLEDNGVNNNNNNAQEKYENREGYGMAFNAV
jgi:hypothetical protein